ncbi:MAG: hypothetical protein JNJ44_03065 [Zoogloeaceae bacterium]|nr:hypothetical protein [Zoogloeaceae bacterium]
MRIVIRCRLSPWRLIVVCLIWAAIVRSAGAELVGPIAVVYPEVGEPYRGVFLKIVEGIQDRFGGRALTVAVGGRATVQDVAEDLRRQDVRLVIALGRQGLNVAGGLEPKIPVVVGAVVNAPEAESRSVAIHSLAPDPALLFARLKGFLPEVRRIFAVYEPANSGWQIRIAKESAKSAGLELVVTEVADLKAAARAYHSIFDLADPKKDAIWLLQDPVGAEESTILPFVLEEAWGRNMPLFSSNLGHVRRGALFTLYPDNERLGRRLGVVAQAVLSGSTNPTGVTPLREVLLAVNQRSAQHLGISINPRQQGIELILPAQ